jgi:exodeoxyribonuclease-3
MVAMKIISFNLNGIRSAISKGLCDWLERESPDILCVQEIKARPQQINISKFKELGYHVYIHSAQKSGYSGVAVFSKPEADHIQPGIGISKFDDEGRLLRVDFGELTLINSYFPSGTMGDVRQSLKMAYLEAIQDFVAQLKPFRPNMILSGDFNICHQEIDISNPQNKIGVSGFLPEEREWFSQLLASGFIDSFRFFDQSPHKYSWWSYRAGARAKNLGWRIDYHLVSENLREQLQAASILNHIKMSDHCPVVVELSGRDLALQGL